MPNTTILVCSLLSLLTFSSGPVGPTLGADSSRVLELGGGDERCERVARILELGAGDERPSEGLSRVLELGGGDERCAWASRELEQGARGEEKAGVSFLDFLLLLLVS